MSNTTSGTVKWFNETKGFSFIEQASGPGVFAHFSEILNTGFKTMLVLRTSAIKAEIRVILNYH